MQKRTSVLTSLSSAQLHLFPAESLAEPRRSSRNYYSDLFPSSRSSAQPETTAKLLSRIISSRVTTAEFFQTRGNVRGDEPFRVADHALLISRDRSHLLANLIVANRPGRFQELLVLSFRSPRAMRHAIKDACEQESIIK